VIGKQSAVANSSVRIREESHRRATLMAISFLLIFSTAPVIGHHLSASVGVSLRGLDHIGAFCVVALRSLLAPVHLLFHVALAGGFGYACWDRWRAWKRQVDALSPLDVAPPRIGEPLFQLAATVGLNPVRLSIVEGLPNPAFTAGLVSPRVFVASDLLLRLPEREVVAVLAHEAEHVRRRDPLRVAVFRFLALTLFWIPALRRLSDDMADEVEILADDAATRGEPLVLASAILGVAAWGQQLFTGAVGFQRSDLLDRRIRRLAGEDAPVRSHLTRWSIAGAALALALVVSSGALVAAPLASEAGGAGARDCLHRGESALAHLFCAGFHRASAGASRCPHTLASSQPG